MSAKFSIKALDHMVLYVASIEASVAFYTTHLGMAHTSFAPAGKAGEVRYVHHFLEFAVFRSFLFYTNTAHRGRLVCGSFFPWMRGGSCAFVRKETEGLSHFSLLLFRVAALFSFVFTACCSMATGVPTCSHHLFAPHLSSIFGRATTPFKSKPPLHPRPPSQILHLPPNPTNAPCH